MPSGFKVDADKKG
jgi:hypothetical protein